MGFRKRASDVAKISADVFFEFFPFIIIVVVVCLAVWGISSGLDVVEAKMIIKQKAEQEWRDNLPDPLYSRGDEVHIKVNSTPAVIGKVFSPTHDGDYGYEITYADDTGQIHKMKLWQWELKE